MAYLVFIYQAKHRKQLHIDAKPRAHMLCALFLIFAAMAFDISVVQWIHVDDGVMGGLSGSQHHMENDDVNSAVYSLHFTGTIDTNGGGFCSIRAPLEASMLQSATGVRVVYRGDGKTYKLLLSQGRGAGGPNARQPSWQADLPTLAHGQWQSQYIDFADFQPHFGGRSRRRPDPAQFTFQPVDMKEMGMMLSLKLSNGDANPVKSFGEGVFPFALQIKSIDFISRRSQN